MDYFIQAGLSSASEKVERRWSTGQEINETVQPIQIDFQLERSSS